MAVETVHDAYSKKNSVAVVKSTLQWIIANVRVGSL